MSHENKPKKIDGDFLREAVMKHLEAAKSGTLREYTALWHGIIPLKKRTEKGPDTEPEVHHEKTSP